MILTQVGGPRGLSSGAESWPKILPDRPAPGEDDSTGPALFDFKPGSKPGPAERFQTVFAIGVPFAFLWSYAVLRGVEGAQGMTKEEGRALEKRTLVVASISGSALIALLD